MGTGSETVRERGSARLAGSARRLAAAGAAGAVIAVGGLVGAGVADAAPAAGVPSAVPCRTSSGLVGAVSVTACRLLGGVVVTGGNVVGSVPQIVPRVVQLPRVVQQPAQVVTGVTQAPAAAAPSTGSSSGGSSSRAPSSSAPSSAASTPRAVPRAAAPAPAPVAAAPVAPTQNYGALMSSAYDRLPASFLSGAAPGGFASLAPGGGMYDPGLLFSANGPVRSLPGSPVSSNSSTQALALPDIGGVGVPLLATVVGGAAILAFAVRAGVLRRVRRKV